MNPFAALDQQPASLLPAQLLLMGLFLTSYVAAVTRLLGPRGRWRSAGVALLAALGLGLVITPWTLAALLVACSVGATGLFIGLTWALSRLLGVHNRAPVLERELEEEAGVTRPAPTPVLQQVVEPTRMGSSPARFGPPTAPARLS
ncbi:hypothetical protein [Variovorax sp. YR752]|uniref:hypothetical protein n=1 Tax=Variovorax sp. YR752 TaxID=1884383 RepID=UPI003138401A